MADSKYLVVGLGNPGPDYHLTRHNVGFFFVDHFAGAQGWRLESVKMHGVFCQERLMSCQVYCVKPQTFMNRSGECVRAFVNYFRIPIENILVLHDDLDLPSGKVKAVRQGGTGGHNGIHSLVQYLGTQKFARIKIGIGRPFADETGQLPPVDKYVLSRMSPVELTMMEQYTPLVEEAITLFIRSGIDSCMNAINRK